MKIAYVIDTDISNKNSIVNKIEAKIKIWENYGIQVIVYSLLSSTSKSILKNGVICQIKNNDSKFLYINSVKVLKNQLTEYKPDLIYSRYIRYIPGLINALTIKNTPYIVEINTNDVEENKLSSIKKNIYNNLTRSLLLKNSSGFVCVTEELAKDKNFSKFNKNSLILSNGINVDNFTESNNYKNKSTNRIVFIGTENQEWQGFEKIIFLAKKLPKYNFDIIGIKKIHLEKVGIIKIPKNIFLHGFLPLEENKKIVNDAIVGIGTLSLYKKNMNEACALKTRQYLAQGIPVIVGYKDTDLINKNLPFVLELENTPNNIKDNINKINDFILEVKNYERKEIIKFATHNLDTKIKEVKRLNFIKEIINVNKT